MAEVSYEAGSASPPMDAIYGGGADSSAEGAAAASAESEPRPRLEGALAELYYAEQEQLKMLRQELKAYKKLLHKREDDAARSHEELVLLAKYTEELMRRDAAFPKYFGICKCGDSVDALGVFAPDLVVPPPPLRSESTMQAKQPEAEQSGMEPSDTEPEPEPEAEKMTSEDNSNPE